MNVSAWKLSDIRSYANKPRDNDKAVAAVAASIKAFGFRQPIVVDEHGVIIVGHMRYKAALLLGLETVPVHVAVGLTPAQVRAYRLADNQTAALATWQEDLLVQELLQLKELDVDLSLLGFSSQELTELLAQPAGPALTDPDEIPEALGEAITQPGDLYQLGKHRVLCGDSGEPEDVDRLVAGQPIHLVNTDPPYGVKLEPRSNNAIADALVMEIDPHYCDVIVRRWEQFTGKKAERTRR